MKKQHKNLGNPNIPDYSTLKEIIVTGTKRGGDKRMVMYLDREKNMCEMSYNQMWRKICGLGTYFKSLGLVEHKKIAIIGENVIEWVIAYYAVLCGGNINVPMDYKLPAEDLADQLIRCGCDALVYTAKFSSMVEEFKKDEKMPVRHWFCIDDFDSFIENGLKIYDGGDKSFEDIEVKPDDLACISYTSGTTAKSKGVMLSHKNIASNCVAACRAHSGRHVIGFIPLNHTYAWVSALFATYIVIEWGYMCDSIKDIQKDLVKIKPYNFSAVPLVVETIYDKIWKTARKTGREDVLKKGLKISNFLMKLGIDKRRKIFKTILDNLGGNLDMIICGSANLDSKYEKGMHDFGIDVFNGYGLTECSPGVTCNRADRFKFGSVGTPLDCCEIKIVNPDDEGVGEIYVKGTNVMVGYYGDPEATAAAFDGEWLKTGDFGRIDKDGFLFMVGRKKNLICLSNGKNVSPEELEDKLRRIDYVAEVLVYADDKKIIGEFFLNEEDYPDARERLKGDVDAFNRKMPSFKNINKIIIRDEEFPKTTTLKIARKYN
ncbi:MAG: AMP-binding protein [Clostridia bacterium]|nr:AMP-binding protein [Clostridia bacterium]